MKKPSPFLKIAIVLGLVINMGKVFSFSTDAGIESEDRTNDNKVKDAIFRRCCFNIFTASS
jgi:hypothetical protein